MRGLVISKRRFRVSLNVVTFVIGGVYVVRQAGKCRSEEGASIFAADAALHDHLQQRRS